MPRKLLIVPLALLLLWLYYRDPPAPYEAPQQAEQAAEAAEASEDKPAGTDRERVTRIASPRQRAEAPKEEESDDPAEAPGSERPAERPSFELEQSVWPASPEGIDGAVREVIVDIRDCYSAALEEVPDLEGRLRVRFTIGEVEGMGEITEIGVVDSNSQDLPELVDAPTEDCIMDVMSSMSFDPPEDGGVVIVQYPLTFSSGD